MAKAATINSQNRPFLDDFSRQDLPLVRKVGTIGAGATEKVDDGK
jgi:hypothetical protein